MRSSTQPRADSSPSTSTTDASLDAVQPAVAIGRAPRLLRSLSRPPLNASIVGRRYSRAVAERAAGGKIAATRAELTLLLSSYLCGAWLVGGQLSGSEAINSAFRSPHPSRRIRATTRVANLQDSRRDQAENAAVDYAKDDGKIKGLIPLRGI